jgi:putative transposase
MLVHQAFRFELDPNNVARARLASHAGAARFAYNWGLALVVEGLAARRALRALALRQGASPGEAEQWADDVVGPLPWTLPALRRSWNRAKTEVAPWWAESSKEAYNSGLDALARALEGWSRSRRGQRKGPRVGFPRFHKRGGGRSFRVTTGSFGVVDGRHVRLPHIGVIRTKEPTAKLIAHLDASTARVLSATVSEVVGRWYVSFGCEVERAQTAPPQRGAVVGVDVGVRSLAVLSTGEVVPNPRHLGRYQRRMARLQGELARRRGPRPGRPPSKRWQESKRRLARAHARVAAARGDGLHKLTTALAAAHGTVVVEDLNVAAMTASAKRSGRRRAKAGLNRAILDASPAELRRRLAYKCAWYGSVLVVADRWYPSSKACSACGRRKPSLPLACRTYRCEDCGLVADRDHNAALNLAALVGAVIGTGSGPGTGQGDLANGRGDERSMGSPRCSSTNRQDGTGPVLGKTVTATRQRVAPEPVLIGSDR